MKTVFARVITALVMIAGFTSCIWAGSKGEHVTEKRHVADFTSIDIKLSLIHISEPTRPY